MPASLLSIGELSRRTGMSVSARILWQAVRPSITGIRTSKRTNVGLIWRTRSKALAPSPQLTAKNPLA